MPHPIRSIAIVGGGTAGWMSAVYLNRALGDDVRITVVESESIGTIGVGEATFNTIKSFFDYVGLDEKDWMPSCDATYKMAIKFVGWNASGTEFFHPFQRYGDVRGIDLPEWWLRTRRSQPFDYACFNVPVLCDRKRSPKFFDGAVFDCESHHSYGYHFDAKLLANFLRAVAMHRGVDYVCADVQAVNVDDGQKITSLVLADRRTVDADFFIDCSGFRGLLINKALGEPFESFSRSLLCDSAIAARGPVGTEGINPYTTATALSCGWVWDIPLYSRVGTGYVYSSAFTSAEAAEKEFRAHLGGNGRNVDTFHIKMRIGRSRNSWVGNCLSVGLSSGFVEPLESTGIFFIQYALAQFVNHYPTRETEPAIVQSFNRSLNACIDGVRDFLILHYRASNRMDTAFWRQAKATEVSSELAGRLELWSKRLPNSASVNPVYHGFAPYSYCVMLLGLGYEPRHSLPILEHLGIDAADEVFAAIENRGLELSKTLPSHEEYLAVLHSDERLAEEFSPNVMRTG